MKLVVEEASSDGVRRLVADDPDHFSSAIAAVEVERAVRRRSPTSQEQAERLIAQMTLVRLSDRIRREAAAIRPLELRSLDAIHLATALGARSQLDGLVTYDAHLAEAAEAHGLAVLSPA